MSRIEIRRTFQSERVTLGTLIAPRMPWPLCTIELPWVNNQVNVSRIPPGTYRWSKQHSPSMEREVIRLDDTETRPRTAILIHVGNYASNFEGCIGVGHGYGDFKEKGRGVVSSGAAFDELMASLSRTGKITIFDNFLRIPPNTE